MRGKGLKIHGVKYQDPFVDFNLWAGDPGWDKVQAGFRKEMKKTSGLPGIARITLSL